MQQGPLRRSEDDCEEVCMEKKLEKKVSVSYTYDPKVKTLEVICDYNGLGDGFCATFDDSLSIETVHEFIEGFLLFLQEKQQQQ